MHIPRRVCLLLALTFLTPVTPFAAEYQGRNVDGELYDATAYSYSTGKYYTVSVEFDGDEAVIFFPKGGLLRLTLDDEEIDDPHGISAFDYEHSVYWDLDVDGMD